MSPDPFKRRNSVSLAVTGIVVLVVAGGLAFGGSRLAVAKQREISIGGQTQAAKAPGLAQYVIRRRTEPNRTEILTTGGKLVASMTDGARTAHIEGPKRTFAEARFTPAKVISTTYVRLAPKEFYAAAVNETWFTSWFTKAVRDRSPDILATAMGYTYGARPVKDSDGRQYAGDAAFGPLSKIDPDGRAENSDFYDYLGISYDFPDGVHAEPSKNHILSIDCSGFIRMVYGYRFGYPLRGGNTRGEGLPRQSHAIGGLGPGVQLFPNTGRRATATDRLLPGDIMLFNGGPVLNSTHIEHSGLYLGLDDRGHMRFISSRSQANGPTMGDLHGESIIDGTGHWAERLRTARRI